METEGKKLIHATKVLLESISKDLETAGDISSKNLCLLSRNIIEMQKISITAETIDERNQFHEILKSVDKLLNDCLKSTNL
ncbi:MAG: hypothetical protein K8E24_005570 [Methanobacterium paludis]|nr:hypothetical protein [Methanobacterium paludis]